jgi:hypothetical protein
MANDSPCYTNDDGDDNDLEIDFQLDADGRIALLSCLISNQGATETVNVASEETTTSTYNNNSHLLAKNNSLLRYDTHVVETKLRYMNTTNSVKNPAKPIVKQLSAEVSLPKSITSICETVKAIRSDNIPDDNDNSRNGINDYDVTASKIWDELYYDCEICDNGLMPRTFWIGCNDSPRCSLEQIASDIFHYHTQLLTANGQQQYYNPNKSGAEWWVQIRPSPKNVGRYSMHATPNTKSNDTHNNSNDEVDMTKDGISFHWDKDEELRLVCGGTTYVHPHLSTVTYLTSVGSPTLVTNHRIHNLTGEWIDDTEDNQQSSEAFIAYPYRNKHLSFDGRYLHAAPYDLLFNANDVSFENTDSNTASSSSSTAVTSKQKQRSNRRITFLVNVWLNYIPLKTERFPDTMVDKLSGWTAGCDVHDIEDLEKTSEFKSANIIIGEGLTATATATTSKNQRVGLSFVHLAATNAAETCTNKKRRRTDQNFDSSPVDPYYVQQTKVDLSRDEEEASHNNMRYNSGNNSRIKHTTTIQKYDWPMGDCTSNEHVHADLPIQSVKGVAAVQGNIQIQWIKQNQEEMQQQVSSIDEQEIKSPKKLKLSRNEKVENWTMKEKEQTDKIGLYLYRKF